MDISSFVGLSSSLRLHRHLRLVITILILFGIRSMRACTGPVFAGTVVMLWTVACARWCPFPFVERSQAFATTRCKLARAEGADTLGGTAALNRPVA